MKKIFFVYLFLWLMSSFGSVAHAEPNDTIFITTIQNTTTQKVYDVAISEMTDRAFDVEYGSLDKIIFTKNLDSLSAQYTAIVTFFIAPIKENVRLVINQKNKGMAYGNALLFVPSLPFETQVAVKHLIPVVQTIRNQIDNTPIKNINNETEKLSQAGELSLGITLAENDNDGRYVIQALSEYGYARTQDLSVGDIIEKVRGYSFKSGDKEGLENYINNLWDKRENIVMVVKTKNATKTIRILNPNKGEK